MIGNLEIMLHMLVFPGSKIEIGFEWLLLEQLEVKSKSFFRDRQQLKQLVKLLLIDKIYELILFSISLQK